MGKGKSQSLIEMIKGPLGFVVVLFVMLTMAGIAALSDVSADIKTAATTAAGFLGVYVVIWVVNYLR